MAIKKLPPNKPVTGREYNELVDLIQSIRIESTQNIKKVTTSHGTHLIGTPGPGNPKALIAEVDSDATGGGYYNCHLQSFDNTKWESNNDPISGNDIGDSIVVLNLAEAGSSVHNLDAGDTIICWTITDDGGNSRYVGVEVFGRHTFGEW